MLSRLATAVALAPLVLASTAQAQVTISGDRTAAVQTSTVDSGSAADLTIADGGSIAVTSGAALIGDSNNSITLADGSAITLSEADSDVTGILLRGGYTGFLTVGGAITITEDYTAEDEDEDGDVDGPFAEGSGRYGIRVTNEGTRTGDITLEDAGSITVYGNQSYGLSLESDLVGDIGLYGAIAVVGDDSYGVRLQGAVSGDVLLPMGSISVSGANAVGLSVEGAVSGLLDIQSSITSTGYRYTSSPTSLTELDADVAAAIKLSADTLYLEDLDADDLLQGGPAVQVKADVAGGILLGTAPTYADPDGEDGDDDGDGVTNGDEDDDGDGTINSADDDRDGDGILDASESTASIASYGGALALLIGSSTADVTIGAVGTGDDAWGLINQGTVAAYGVYDDVVTTALQVGGLGGGTTLITGGILNESTIVGSSVGADAVAVRLAAGADVATLINNGTITGSATTEDTDVATAIQIDQDAILTSLVNNGQILGVIYGEAGDAVAIRDLSGTLTSLTNTGTIYGNIVSTDSVSDTDDDDEDADNEVETGHEIAIDLSANTTGVTITQTGALTDNRFTDSDGDGVYDNVDTDDDGDGIPDDQDTDDNDDDNDGVYDTDEPYIYGAILLGSGADTVDIQNGAVVGDISFGDGADAFLMSGGSTYVGALSDSDGLLDIAIADATLDARQTTALNVTSLTVGAGGELVANIDPLTHTAGGFNVSGAASFADASIISLHLTSLIDDPERFTLVTAGSLTWGDVTGSNLTGSTPYMVVADFKADTAAGQVYVDVRRRTTTEMALSTNETAAYDAFYSALSGATDVMDAFLATTDRADFMNLYEQTLPDHSGGTLMSLASGVDAVTQALANRNTSAEVGSTSGWMQEINFYADKDKTESYGYRTEGFAVAGGLEKVSKVGALGVSLAMTSSDIEDPESEAEEVLSASLIELGAYWRAQGHGWTGWARAAAGYATFRSTRTLVGDDVYLSNTADWNGYTLSAAAGVAWEHRFGRLSLRPELYAETFSLTEGSRTESGGGDAFDLIVDGREGSISSATAAVRIGYGFGQDGFIRPELKLGWKQILASDGGETIARYASGGSEFSLISDLVEGGGPIAGLGLTVANELGSFRISGDAQLLEDYVRYSLLLQATFRF
ncbi:autotransporter outer membrane beta-barrel domain-containing protein [Brevundimonas goettingensis]|uniref:Autotransporter outer membrane beta-barrel domain-containing protein n=1 Tax=Brevundimonas goettingensis TaxID=2774190 RepID=A0A975BYR1_9CAUL|nr:autotransporter outer membrane beta-barrel domain-containing protein [Brevundimonas goettingensis]QTC89870.1 autotransporter outer membrane beta-barrel domain-containing protein [Brevundimonas goettingensis]